MEKEQFLLYHLPEAGAVGGLAFSRHENGTG
jgi:hypothetical protein